jgi:GAF domain-containing protein
MYAIDANPELRDQLQFLLAQGKFDRATELLNDTAPYRFTALYRIAGGALQNLVVYDRAKGAAQRWDTIPLGESYCDYVNRARDAFIVEDSASDPRVEGHAKRAVVHAYCGVPLLGVSGELLGTVCHFDFDPVPLDQDALQWLQAVARMFDPRVHAETLARGMQPRIDALEAVSQLLAETASDGAEARAAFEDYARPVRDGVSGLPIDIVEATHHRIDGILQRMSHAVDARAAHSAPP